MSTLSCNLHVPARISSRPRFVAAFLTFSFLLYYFPGAEKMLLGAAPQSETPTVSFQAVALLCSQLLQYGLELPEQIGHPTKRRTTVVPPLWVFLQALFIRC